MFTFLEMLALVESESCFGAYVCHKRPAGLPATSDLVGQKKIMKLFEMIYSINTKNYWKQKKRLCVRFRSGDKHYLRKSADRKAQISSGERNERIP